MDEKEDIKRSLKYTIDLSEDLIKDTDDAEKIKALSQMQNDSVKSYIEMCREQREQEKKKNEKFDKAVTIVKVIFEGIGTLAGIGCLVAGSVLAFDQKEQESESYIPDKETKKASFDLFRFGRRNL